MQRRSLLTEMAGGLQEVQQVKQQLSLLGPKKAQAHPLVKKALVKKAQVAAPAVVQVFPLCMLCTGSTASGGAMQAVCIGCMCA